MKKCTKCKEEKLLEDFYKRKIGKYTAECKSCLKIRSDKWHKDNPEKTIKAKKKYERKMGIGVPIPCKQCGEMFVRKDFTGICSIKCRLLNNIEIKEKTECWNWTGLLGGEYGKTRWHGKTMSAHRASYMIFKGEIDKKLCVCHSCDNKLCINPDHLYLGTHKENHQHAVDRGLINNKGINNVFCKFTDEQIQEIKRLKLEGFTYERLRRIFNCSNTHIYNVIKNLTRKL